MTAVVSDMRIFFFLSSTRTPYIEYKYQINVVNSKCWQDCRVYFYKDNQHKNNIGMNGFICTGENPFFSVKFSMSLCYTAGSNRSKSQSISYCTSWLQFSFVIGSQQSNDGTSALQFFSQKPISMRHTVCLSCVMSYTIVMQASLCYCMSQSCPGLVCLLKATTPTTTSTWKSTLKSV